MKKQLLTVSICLLLTICCLLCSGCSLFYHLQQEGAIWLGYNKPLKKSFVANIEWNPNEGNRIEIPSEYMEATVDTLGGYYGRGVPSPFGVSMPIRDLFPDADYYYCTLESYLHDQSEWDGAVEVHDYPITIVLPDDLKTVEYVRNTVDVAQYDQDGQCLHKVARVVYSFEIADTNPYFYTLEGRLYDKNNDELVDMFTYDVWEE